MKSNKFIQDITKDIDEPLPISDNIGIFRKGKIQVIIVYEDKTYNTYYVKNKENYMVTIKKKKYLLITDCVIHGRNPTLIYYYNNPMPIKLKWEKSALKSMDISKITRKDTDMNIPDISIDADMINVAFNSNLVNKMYHENRLTTKNLIIILVVVTVIILVILQVTGVVDVMGFISGSAVAK